MANLKLIKELAQIKGMTIDQLAAKANVTTQAIHLMGRSGKTKMETFEKIAEILEVPPYVFYDGNFDVRLFRDYVVKGHHNPTSFLVPSITVAMLLFRQRIARQILKPQRKWKKHKRRMRT